MIGGPDDHSPEMAVIRERNRLKRVALWHAREERKRQIKAAWDAGDVDRWFALRYGDPTVRRIGSAWPE